MRGSNGSFERVRAPRLWCFPESQEHDRDVNVPGGMPVLQVTATRIQVRERTQLVCLKQDSPGREDEFLPEEGAESRIFHTSWLVLIFAT
jgi:hypothetical protein